MIILLLIFIFCILLFFYLRMDRKKEGLGRIIRFVSGTARGISDNFRAAVDATRYGADALKKLSASDISKYAMINAKEQLVKTNNYKNDARAKMNEAIHQISLSGIQ